MCVLVKLQVPICFKYDEFKGKWTNVGFVFNEDQNGELTSKGYVNGKLVESTKISHRLGKPSNRFYKGIVLGNDVDWTLLDDPDRFADPKMSELYLYNRVFTNDEIMSAFHHKLL